jgi:CheY-specific phosphatase CheX
MGLQTEREAHPLSAEDINHIAAWYAEVANPVLRAAAETLEGLMELRATRGTPSLIRSAYTEEDITIAISVDGALKGLVLLGLSYRTAFRLLQQMLGEELDSNLPISDFLQESELARSALQEIANTLAGRAAMHLEAAGKVCMISPPELTMRRGILLSQRDFQRLVIPLHTDAGSLRLEIALTPSDEMPRGNAASFFVAQRIVQPRQSIVRYDFANPDRLGRGVYALLQQVHDRFPTTLNQLLLMRVRMSVHLSPLRLEKDSCAHFLRRDYGWSVAAAFQVMGRGVWLLTLSRSIALRLMDRWLGGPGQSVERPSEGWTPLEQAILRGLLTTFAEAYAAAWAQIGERMELRLTQLFVGDWTEQAATLIQRKRWGVAAFPSVASRRRNGCGAMAVACRNAVGLFRTATTDRDDAIRHAPFPPCRHLVAVRLARRTDPAAPFAEVASRRHLALANAAADLAR